MHGRTGAFRQLMGSVADQVSRQASCPVLTWRMGGATSELATACLTGERQMPEGRSAAAVLREPLIGR